MKDEMILTGFEELTDEEQALIDGGNSSMAFSMVNGAISAKASEKGSSSITQGVCCNRVTANSSYSAKVAVNAYAGALCFSWSFS